MYPLELYPGHTIPPHQALPAVGQLWPIGDDDEDVDDDVDGDGEPGGKLDE